MQIQAQGCRVTAQGRGQGDAPIPIVGSADGQVSAISQGGFPAPSDSWLGRKLRNGTVCLNKSTAQACLCRAWGSGL